jgi:hypothetical protein
MYLYLLKLLIGCKQVLTRVISLVYLESTFNTLHKAKEQCEENNKHRRPKSVPLHPPPTIIPQVSYAPWLHLVKDLFQNNKPIMPISEVFDLPCVGA